MWDGPPIDGIKDFDPAIRDLTEILESRRVSPEDAEKAIKEYAAKLPEAERDKKLTELFASVLNEINTDRQFVMSKVEEFQKRQKGRAAELEREGQKLAEKGIAATDELLPTETKLTPEQQEYNWNARIFQERQQNLTMACEIPALIEQRAYRDRPPDPRADEELTSLLSRTATRSAPAALAAEARRTSRRLTAASSLRRADSPAPASRRSRRGTT